MTVKIIHQSVTCTNIFPLDMATNILYSKGSCWFCKEKICLAPLLCNINGNCLRESLFILALCVSDFCTTAVCVILWKTHFAPKKIARHLKNIQINILYLNVSIQRKYNLLKQGQPSFYVIVIFLLVSIFALAYF